MNPMPLMLISTTLMMGTLITLTSSNWILMWMGLELNMLAMVPLMTMNKTNRSTEAATKYFLTQSTASMLLLLAVINDLNITGQWNLMEPKDDITQFLLMISMAMKLGLAPFHLWVPEVTQGVPMALGLILLTWQKLAPMAILYQMAPYLNVNIMITMSLMSVLLGGWGGLNQTQLRKIMAYSSIAHMGWMMAAMIYNPTAMAFNLLIYILLTLTVFIMLKTIMATTTTSLASSWNTNPFIALMLMISLLSLGGLPPLTGFLPKWYIIQELILNNMTTTALIMTMVSLLNLYFYVRLIYSTSMTMFPMTNANKFKWLIKPNNSLPLIPTLLVLSSFSLPLSPMIYAMM
uniref:NADH dehydrogenase subunit 2 n=1 Tax=Geomys pinetis TaxID=100306 RepID=UPI0022A770CA|nr:NADH dehydrogenase subunit 2 [Geomys pinetis]UFK29029.1 NADH dehydrogenase subunit 2 [Geomys pinetis]UFK29146.1 NADH dehydrogenase subunit 2 [Geomys pinetis]